MTKSLYIVGISLIVLVGCGSNEESNSDYLPSSWSTVGFRSLCKERESHMAPNELVREHDGKTYYNKKVSETDHDTQITFDFISDCCQAFLGKHEEKDNKLYLYYYPDSNSVKCDCKCDYRMIYTFVHNNQPRKDWDRIIIKKVEGL